MFNTFFSAMAAIFALVVWIVRFTIIYICLLTKILTTIKDALSGYCNTRISHNGVNNMWILKNSISLLSSLEKLDVRYASSVQTFDFSSLYPSISHDLLKSHISTFIRNSFKKKDGSVRHTYIKVDGRRWYFSNSVDSGGDKLIVQTKYVKWWSFWVITFL